MHPPLQDDPHVQEQPAQDICDSVCPLIVTALIAVVAFKMLLASELILNILLVVGIYQTSFLNFSKCHHELIQIHSCHQ